MGENFDESIMSVQLETTSRCNLSCVTCLKPEYYNSWCERDMEVKLFYTIVEQIKGFKPIVHLQGWGEPLLQKDFLAYVKRLKKDQICTSFTSNGSVMDTGLAVEIINTGVDGVTFSMAGFRSSTQNALRGEGSMKRVKDAISIMTSARKKLKQLHPLLAVSYLLTPQTVKELPQAISWCRKVGIDSFVTVNLTQVGGQAQHGLQFCPTQNEAKKFRIIRTLANISAFPGDMKLDLKPFSSTLTPVCDKNPINNLFISANGDVGPCVFLAPPVIGGINWYNTTEQKNLISSVMGNLNKSTLKEIWDREKYRKFRRRFKQRKEYYDKSLQRVSYTFSGPVELELAVTKIREYFQSHPPPDECLFCAKN